MPTSDDLFCVYLRLVCRLSGGEAATLWLPSAGERWGPVWQHVGGAPPLPELNGADAAAPAPPAASAPRPSLEPGGWLLPLPGAGFPRRSPDDPPKPRRRAADRTQSAQVSAPVGWLGVRLGRAAPAPGADGHWPWLLALGAQLAAYCRQTEAVISDPLTGLPGRAAFQTMLRHELERARQSGRPVSLLLVNPDGLTAVNDRLGWPAGDRVLAEVADRLRGGMRSGDRLFRYGAAVFAVLLPAADEEHAAAVGEKILQILTGEPYLAATLRLGFHLGIAHAGAAAETPAADAALELLRWADHALAQAGRPDSAPLVVWKPELKASEAPRDRMRGLFTGDFTRDYRHMRLFWDTMEVLAAHDRPRDLARYAAERLAENLEVDRAALVLGHGGELELLALNDRRRPEDPGGGWAQLSGAEKALLARATAETRLVEGSVPGEGRQEAHQAWACAVPLAARGTPLGGLVLTSPRRRLPVDEAERTLLRALARQLATALDRVLLAEEEQRRRERDQERLLAEVEDMGRALVRMRLVARSPQMAALLELARRAAVSEATVLVTGPSGTGKEVLARTVHELSPRRSRPLVVVDCSAIPETLVDSELFGHTRGAYTGAQEAAPGRLAEADGGTVILDEIGELPLPVQAKLLRFVETKEILPVGGRRPRRLDVRLIAVTHRDLATEARAGRFREDLYHRLDVLRLHLPPLAERGDDVLPLAEHFLAELAAEHGRPRPRLTPEAETWLLAQGWPGNVRQLRNHLLRAVLLAGGREIRPQDLERQADGSNLGDDALPLTLRSAADAAGAERTAVSAESVKAPRARGGAGAWASLREELRRQVEAAVGQEPPPPLGRWLAEDLLLAAHAVAEGVQARGAARLGMPKSTFQRRLRQAEAEVPDAARPPGWEAVREHLARLVAAVHPPGTKVLGGVRALLLARVRERLPGDERRAAALMGVTVKTWRRWLETVQRGKPEG